MHSWNLFSNADFTVDHFDDTSLLSNPLELEEVSVSQLPENTEDDVTIKPVESDMDKMTTPVYERKEQNRVSDSHIKKQGIVQYY